MLLAFVAATSANVNTPVPPFRFAKAVGNGMILAAAPKQAMIWGFCEKEGKVTVGIAGKIISATVGPDQADGKLTTWRVLLPATKASFDTHNITASSSNVTLTLADVMFGEVWVCSGQSNMAYPLGSPTCWNASNINCTDTNKTKGHNTAQCGYGCVENAGEEIAAMANYDSGMRLYSVGFSSEPTPQADTTEGHWETPSKMGGRFSAMCWFFGRDVYAKLSPKVPVGLIETNVGGTPDQHWSSPDALQQCKGHGNSWDWPDNFTDSVLWNGEFINKDRAHLSVHFTVTRTLCFLHEGMVVPLLRTVHSGAIWMQVSAECRACRRV
jgi:sialate O-acetylesterase